MINKNVTYGRIITPSWCYQDNIFTDNELSYLTGYFSNQQLFEGEIGPKNELKSDVRRSKINFMNWDPNHKWIFDRFNNLIDSINNEYYNFDLLGYEHIQYSEYREKENGEYNFHMDMAFDSSDHYPTFPRKLSLAMLLNEPEKDFLGGGFEINFGPEDTAKIPTKKNRAIIFPSFLIHKVNPVIRGTRKSLVIWVIGPKFR